jgi:ubiquinone/menaquinone biosynthesis C-methylase UbiE
MNKDIFLQFEGDNFFNRNMNSFNNNNDIIINNLTKILNKNTTSLNILEIGCSNGYRLNELKLLFLNNNYYGIDPSEKAINYGINNFKDINFKISTCDKLDFYEDNKFDIILIPFVFMYIDRNLLLKSIYEIDRILKNNGKLIITDFYSNRPRKNKYKYVDNTFIYKQHFYKIFISTNNYFLEKLEYFLHNTSNKINDIYDETCFYVELKKDLDNMFN